MRAVLPLLLACLATACASMSDPGSVRGWHGQGAEPFDGARDACEAQAADQPAGTARTAAFERCMAAKGWHRG